MSRQDFNKKIVKRIFIAQCVLILVSAFVLAVIAVVWPDQLGSFIFAFLFGCFGGSVSLIRRLHKEPIGSLELIADSWISTMMPLLYGGLMASIAYMLFVSGLLTGDNGGGLFTSNLFPLFEDQSAVGGRVGILDILDIRPVSIESTGKLMVWCFLAGYSESFVSSVLATLENRGAAERKDQD